MDVEEGHCGGRLGSSRECDAEEHVCRDRQVQERKRVQRTNGERTSRIVGSKSCPSGPEGLLRKSTWQVADARRPLVSASHIIQAGNDLFIGKDEEHIMNMRKMEKSMLRKGMCTRLICS